MKGKIVQIRQDYEFDLNDIRALIMVINVICIFVFGLSISWLGLAVAIVGLVDDVVHTKRICHCLIHFSGILMNLYFISEIKW